MIAGHYRQSRGGARQLNASAGDIARSILGVSDPIKRAIWTGLFGVVVLLAVGMIILRFVVLPHIDDSENRVLETRDISLQLKVKFILSNV